MLLCRGAGGQGRGGVALICLAVGGAVIKGCGENCGDQVSLT